MAYHLNHLLDMGRNPPLRATPEMHPAVQQYIEFTEAQAEATNSRITQKKKQIARMQVSLKGLEFMSRKVERQSVQLKSLVAGPISRLPPELLAYILTLPYSFDDESERPKAIALTKSRDQSLSFPQWSFFSKSMRKFDGGGAEEDFLARVWTVFERSRRTKSLLDIKLSYSNGEGGPHNIWDSPVEIVLLNSERIRSVQCDELRLYFLHCHVWEFPVLEELRLKDCFPATCKIPQLRYLMVLNHDFQEIPAVDNPRFNILWSPLTSVSLFWNGRPMKVERRDPGDLLKLLTHMPNLATLRVNFGDFPSEDEVPLTPGRYQTILMPNLKTFEIQDPGTHLLHLKAMAAVNAPRLERFDYLFEQTDTGNLEFHPMSEKPKWAY
ncbi:hypothetical protein BKA70DRAFT_1493546 [Coprinopsis sp. MPI-PUGE-AT-0042]|nr:hypothetical protein BKA70DRAFT_1493546 [Coprinopsis sp. MPI-PUGE-AT-0042]